MFRIFSIGTPCMITAKKINSPLALLLKNDPKLFSALKAGDLVEGVLMKQGMKVAYFDLGSLGTGIVYGIEYTNASSILKSLEEGEKVLAKIVEAENDDGYVELSLAEAGKQKMWQDLKELKEKGEIMPVKITGANSGGLMTEVNGIKGFIPASQLSTEHYPRIDDGNRAKILDELKKYIGQEFKVKILDLKPRANKLIFSEKELMEENTKELLDKYVVGQVVDGLISGVTDFGAFMKFVDTPSLEGLIHISELDHKLIEHPKEIVKINDSVKAKIIEIKDGRISLSLKALKPNPWDTIEAQYKAGDEITGTINRFNPFGAFVGITSDIQGLIHVSEFGSVEKMKETLEVGKQYPFKIELMKPSEKRIILKMVKK